MRREVDVWGGGQWKMWRGGRERVGRESRTCSSHSRRSIERSMFFSALCRAITQPHTSMMRAGERTFQRSKTEGQGMVRGDARGGEKAKRW